MNTIRVVLLVGTLSVAQSVQGGSVLGSRHDLSSTTTTQVCEFCHTPHVANLNVSGSPLWNRAETTQTFTLYGSPTLQSQMSQPGGVSRLCLSCHDGVNASTSVHGNLVSTKHALVNPPDGGIPDTTSYPNCERCHTDIYSGGRRTLVLGTNLMNDHPISFPYPGSGQVPGFRAPADALNGWGGTSQNEVKLYAGWIECGSCHNVHNPDTKPFLRKPNTGSALCLTCHQM